MKRKSTSGREMDAWTFKIMVSSVKTSGVRRANYWAVFSLFQIHLPIFCSVQMGWTVGFSFVSWLPLRFWYCDSRGIQEAGKVEKKIRPSCSCQGSPRSDPSPPQHHVIRDPALLCTPRTNHALGAPTTNMEDHLLRRVNTSSVALPLSPGYDNPTLFPFSPSPMGGSILLWLVSLYCFMFPLCPSVPQYLGNQY